ncbi:MAG: hypothetical protein H7226_01265 [Salinibacterium sp.]|nr:hypothetical protein [Salinibacterium sp.]
MPVSAAPEDDEALEWAGDERADPAVRVVRERTVGQSQLPALLLVTYGIVGGIHLIYVAGWVVGLQRLNNISVSSSDALTAIMFPLGEALAIVSPMAWFAAAFLLTRGRRSIVRLLWLLAGLVVVAPWPYILGAWVS